MLPTSQRNIRLLYTTKHMYLLLHITYTVVAWLTSNKFWMSLKSLMMPVFQLLRVYTQSCVTESQVTMISVHAHVRWEPSAAIVGRKKRATVCDTWLYSIVQFADTMRPSSLKCKPYRNQWNWLSALKWPTIEQKPIYRYLLTRRVLA